VALSSLRLVVYEHRRFADSGQQHLSLLGVGELVRRDRVGARQEALDAQLPGALAGRGENPASASQRQMAS
jgi:hypothetical protein